MPRPASTPARLRLPARIRVRPSPGDGDSAEWHLALADRIASLPGLKSVVSGELTDDELPTGGIGLSFDDPAGPGAGPRLLFRFTREGLAVYGLADWDRHQVLRSGWGRLKHDHVLLHLPRDAGELDVCWRVVEHAFTVFSARPAGLGPARAASPWDLPRFSRTSLQ